jgi:Spy/CpxP family protein refolding chaperone
MKLTRTLITVTVATLLAGTLAIAQTGESRPDRPQRGGPGGGRGPGGPGAMLDNLLPPRVVDDLKLTAEQKAKYDELQAAFKKDAEKWRSEHADAAEKMRKAREEGDRETLRKLAEERRPLMDARRGYVDKLRETLTAEQKETLEKAMEQVRGRRRPGGPGGPPPGGPEGERPPPPPAD